MPVFTLSYAEYKPPSGTHRDSTSIGTVTVYYKPWGRDTFNGIDRKAFNDWASAAWNKAYLPDGIKIRVNKED